MKAKLCVTVSGATMEELRVNRDGVKDADLVELRLDFVRRPDVLGALKGRRCPVVITCRPTWEGGRFEGSETERHAILAEALDQGAEYVDLEWRAGFVDLIARRSGRGIVLSTHEFASIPVDLMARYRAMRATGAEIVKVAVRADSLSAALALKEIERNGVSAPRILIAMGPAGAASRVLPDRFGSCWTYAGDGVAPGQFDLPRMVDEFRVKALSDMTQVYGVLGVPLEHSLSPAMHNAGFAATGSDAVYLPLEASGVEDFVAFARAFGIRGASVTAPYKEEITRYLSEVDEVGQRIGAVNTLQMTEAGWSGYNTDVPGFLEPLDGRVALGGCRASVLGSGGAARSVAVALAGEGASVTVCARNEGKAVNVARLAGGHTSAFPPALGSWDLLVNATPIGTYPKGDATPLPGGPFDGDLVYDLVYNPTVTRLMMEASDAGCQTIGGLGMLVAQAVRQFELWTGMAAPRKIFEAAAAASLSRQEFNQLDRT